MSGVKSIEDLKDRCYVDEDTGCWHWRMACNNGSPRVRVTVNGKSEMMAGRRAAYMLAYKKAIPSGYKVFRAAHCKSLDCLSPEHVRAGTKKQEGEVIAKTGRAAGSLQRIVAGQIASRKRAKLTLEQVREIRASDETQKVKAKRYGVTEKMIHLIETGQRWKEMALPTADVFSWAQFARRAA
jgi:hypothetical protein